MPRSCTSIRCCDLGLHIPGRAQGGPLEEPAAVILHGGVSEGGVLAAPWWTYTGTKLETGDTAKENLQLSGAPLLGTRPGTRFGLSGRLPRLLLFSIGCSQG